MMTRYLYAVLLAALPLLTAFSQDKKEPFIPMDYSTCGYHASEIPVPDVPNAVVVKYGEGDKYADIQSAIDYVSSLEADINGHRGAVLLEKGNYYISQPLHITASGVVLRGMGPRQTRLTKTGVDRCAAVYVEGVKDIVKGDTIDIVGDVAAGSAVLTLARPLPQDPGGNIPQRIMIRRPSTDEWIKALKMDDFGGGLDYTGWRAGEIDIVWNRTVVGSLGNTITVDAPVTCSIESLYGGGQVVTGYNRGEITESGVELLTIISKWEDSNTMNEDHCWDGIYIDNARDCWVRNVNFANLAGSAVNIQKQTRRITVEDCIAGRGVSELGGWRRNVFFTRGEQTLIQRCVSRHGIHDFATGFCAPGPNAFVQCEAQVAHGFSGSIGSWAPGILFDIVDIEGNDIKFADLEQFQLGTGWNTANSMIWQCTASTIYCYSPDTLNRNSVNGCWATMTGDGEWMNSNNHVKPRSLFYAQLKERLGKDAPDGYILPRNITASSSPLIEEAMEMAMTSLNEPRLTLAAWIDSVMIRKYGSFDEVAFDDKAAVTVKTDARHLKETSPVPDTAFAITDGILNYHGSIITGNRYHVRWWNGRVKDDYLEKSAVPVITRFVPGREGTGLTDRIDSVVTYLKHNGYCMLDHNYGLWYDLRRIDHERIRRADGDVWPPFYEQPFARSGSEMGNRDLAWDGLSPYDLTKPNLWYWSRLKEYADKASHAGLLLFHQNYFQHNILEAGAHWVDCPWRPVNNVNETDFPEPVPFTGDKRVFMAEQFYDVTNETNTPLHKQYIRQCLDNFADNSNVVQLIGEEFTGPLHFVRFWLETIAEWEQQTGCRPLIALSCTKDAQDAVLADPELSKVVDIIDIRYWHYNTDSLWAPPAGKNMAPRQYKRRYKTGDTRFEQVYRAVREYRDAYPDKAVTYYSQMYEEYGWAVLMAGGSLPDVIINDSTLLADLTVMKPVDVTGGYAIGNDDKGYVVYAGADGADISVAPGKYRVYTVDRTTGDVKMSAKNVRINGIYTVTEGICWLQKSK